MTTTTMTGGGDKTVVCALCKGPHYPDQCTKYTTPEDVYNRVNSLSLCFKCLKPGHYSNACKSDRRCFANMGEKKCYGHHNRALHKYFKSVHHSRRAGDTPEGGTRGQQRDGARAPQREQGAGRARSPSRERNVRFVDEAEKNAQASNSQSREKDPANPK